jgi:hypothetical protein
MYGGLPSFFWCLERREMFGGMKKKPKVILGKARNPTRCKVAHIWVEQGPFESYG